MGYQALLFCPDEKTARTVTQVLSELDFAVISCTEPFAAVKKLMGEHFDAVVVDCDNEQNATLLFKSARNAPNNQSALAVAVVEGQAGVAKAFRIGANLVLTKPINVEQAKGTLRVARGLLRKNEIAKPAGTAGKPAAAPPVKSTQVMPIVSSSRPAAPSAPAAAPKIPAPKSAPQTSFTASASSDISEVAESTEPVNAVPKQVPSPLMATSKKQMVSSKVAPRAASEPEPEITLSTPEVAAPKTPAAGFSVGTSAGSASAAAPAREAKAGSSAEAKAPAASPEEEIPVEKATTSSSALAVEESAAPAPTFTFGGAVESGEKSGSGGSKKVLIAVAAILLIAAAGYAAWMQYGPSILPMRAPAGNVARPATTSVVAPQASTAVSASPADSSAASVPSAVAPVASTTPSSTAAQPAATAKPSSSGQTIPVAKNAPSHSSKANPEVESSEPEENDVTVKKSPSVAAKAIVIKNGSAQPRTGAAAVSNDAAAPSIASIAPAGNGGSLPNLMDGASGAPTPVLQTVNVSQGVSQGLILKKVSPSYPTAALRLRLEGSVELLATISKKGDISAVKILSGDPNLARAAVDAVKQWKYKPYLLDGSPVEIQTQVTINFKLPR